MVERTDIIVDTADTQIIRQINIKNNRKVYK